VSDDPGKNSLSEKFKDYYKDNLDLYGNNINKVDLEPYIIDLEYNNFYKYCRIMEMLVTHNVINLKTMRVLDAGCGNGQDLRKMSELGVPPENCYGIDFSEEAIDFAKTHSPAGMHYSRSEMEELPFEDSFFDLVFSFNTLTNHHSDDMIRKIISEFRRVIKDNGILILILSLSDKPVSSEGIGGMPVRSFEINELKKLCEPFSITRVANSACCFTKRPGGVILKDPEGSAVNFDVLENIYKNLVAGRSYDQFYLNGAMNHILAGLNLVNDSKAILALRP
jgi:ubiquinone/menaquinone biosynthesis C-methylase UbiE